MTKKSLLWIVLAAVCFTSIYLIRIREDMVDFRVNYRAGQRLVNGENLYPTTDGHFMFKYLPFSALLYVPFSYLPLEAAKAAWYYLTVFCSIFLFYLSYQIVRTDEHSSAYWMIWPPLILAKFFFREMKLGQINTIVTALMLMITWYLMDERKKSGKEALPGVFWGLATALKPYALIFLPYFIVKGRWRSLLAGIAVITGALVLPSLFYGFTGNLRVLEEWARTLSQSTPSLFTSGDNVSILAFWMKWTGQETLSLHLTGVIVFGLALLVLAIIFRGRRMQRGEVLEYAVLLTLIPLISPLGWDYTFLMAVLAVTLLVNRFHDLPGLWKTILVVNFSIIALVVYDIVGRSFYLSFMGWSVTTVNFLVVVAGLSYLRLRRIA